ncbi:MAG TPA: helix-turn-helix transcriptional regulator [Solirubrobacterales bacterium]|jgi:transcriptional regulator with XRE-family HTH domain
MKDERWNDLGERADYFFRTPYTELVGLRLKRLRQSKGLSQDAARRGVRRPNGVPYSQGLISRIEKGYGNSPLYVYIHFAEVYEVDPGRVMGSDEAQKPISEAEMTLIRFLRRVGVSADDAIARLARPA